MNKTSKLILLLTIIFIIIPVTAYTTDLTSDSAGGSPPWVPKHFIDITIDGGLGVYVGDFYDHLIADGAYFLTPVLDLYLSIFLIRWFGFQVFLSSGTVIHPKSKPIEGTLLYMGIELFGQYDWKRVYIKGFAGAGFQHTTMLLSVYASAFFEGGAGVGIHLTNWLALFHSVKIRFAFLRSLIIWDYDDNDSITKYEENDRLMSVVISLGLVAKIKNPWHVAAQSQ